MTNHANIVKQIKREILTDLRDGIIPSSIHSFGKLHDYVDANEYGGFCVEGGPNEAFQGNITIEEVDMIQDEIDQWLQRGDHNVVFPRSDIKRFNEATIEPFNS